MQAKGCGSEPHPLRFTSPRRDQEKSRGKLTPRTLTRSTRTPAKPPTNTDPGSIRGDEQRLAWSLRAAPCPRATPSSETRANFLFIRITYLSSRRVFHPDIVWARRDKHSEQAKKKGVWSRTTPLFRHCSPAARQSAYSLCRNSANSFSSDARRSTDSGTWMRTFARPSASKLNVAAFLFLTVNVWGFAST